MTYDPYPKSSVDYFSPHNSRFKAYGAQSQATRAQSALTYSLSRFVLNYIRIFVMREGIGISYRSSKEYYSKLSCG